MTAAVITTAEQGLESPASETEAAALVRAAAADRRPIEIVGGGTRRALGRPVQAGLTLSTARLTGVTLYEPSELVISARAGTPLADLTAALDAAGQMLPFEPIDHRVLLGSAGEPTVGGLVATGASGPRRVTAGAARDHLIGVRFVNGRGEVVKSGGRVMKNVTGYDLVKLQTGAYGTLGVVTEATFKVLPKPRATLSLLFTGLDDARAVACLAAGLASPFEVTAAAHLPSVLGAPGRTVLRLENFPASLAYRSDRLADDLAIFGRPSILADDESQALWADIRDVRPLAEPRDRLVWRVSVKPTAGPVVVRHVQAALGAAGAAADDLAWFYDWGGGLVWLAMAPRPDAGAEAVRAAVASAGGGHATLVRADPTLRAAVPVFQPEAPAVAEVSRRIKAVFDPAGVLNPGRMGAW